MGDLSRRRFLSVAAAASGLAVAGGYLGTRTAAAAPTDDAKYRALVPELFADRPDAPDHTTAVVIGSGFGGAVAALRLGQAGVRTTVLERGSRWPLDRQRQIFSSEVIPDGRAYWRRTRFTNITGVPAFTDSFGGVLDAVEYDSIDVWRGSAVGGGSVVFTGVMIEPDRRMFDAAFGGSVDYEQMHRLYYPRARAILRLSTMPDDVYRTAPFHHSRVWDDQVRAAGYAPELTAGLWDWDIVRDELDGRARRAAVAGESNLGTSTGAKPDLTTSYLRLAGETGVVGIYAGHEVLSIGRDRSRYVIETARVAPTGERVATRTLTCDHLFLAAGSVGTSELLVRARATGTLPRLNEHIGEGWGSNGDAAVVRSFSGAGQGEGQAAPCRSRIFDDSGLPLSLENWFIPGIPFDATVIGSLGLVLDSVRGRFVYDSTDDSVGLEFPRAGRDNVDAALRAVNDRIAGANGVGVGFEPLSRDVSSSFTAHPLGGAVIDRATDNVGRVRGYNGLYVVDGALVPGTTATYNPSLTITALAERSMDAIIPAGG